MMDVDVLETLIPFFALASTLLAFVAWLYLRYKARAERQQTLRLALEKGAELSPEFIRELGDPEPSKDRDLRRGLVWMSLAFGLTLCGFAVPEEDALRGLLAAASFPFSIGCAFLVMYVYGVRKESSQ